LIISQQDIEALIEDKIQKILTKYYNWEDEGILVKKARWGRQLLLRVKSKLS
jgi:DNA topoisomerase-1